MVDPDDHWRSLPSNSWEYRDRDSTDNRLTDAQLDYFKEFADCTYSNWKMQNVHIPEAIDDLPARFEDLSEDVAFLEQAGETTEKLWEEMLDIGQRAGYVNDVPFSSRKEPENREMQLGYELGSVIELLMSDSTSKNDRTDIVRGFLLAFCGEPREGIDEDRITTHEFADLLAEKHPPQALSTLEEIKSIQENMGIENQIENAVPNALKQQGITPSAYLLEMLEKNAEKTNDQRSVSNTEADVEFVLHTSPVSTAEAESLVDDFLQVYPEVKVFDDFCEPLLEDTKLIDTTKSTGTPTVEIADTLWQAEEGSSDSEIDRDTGTNTSRAVS